MDLIKDIEALSGKIEELKKNIDKYDAAFRSVDKHNIDKVFGGYKAAQAGAMSVDKLAQSVGVLSSQYGELVSAQEAAKNKMQQMTLAMTQMEQLQKTISAAQREALSSGDYTGATELYKQYVATGESMQLLRMEIESTGAEITAINGKMAEHTQTLERYKQVNDAAIGTKKNVNIADLTNKFETEKNKIIEVSKSLEDYKIKYDATKAVVEKGGLVVGGLEKSKVDLQMYADEISRLSNEYVIAAERAQQYANALGNDENGIPKVEMPKVEPEKVKQAADNMREYAEHAGEADDKLKEVVKAGAMLGGMSYGVHKLKEFAQQVMQTRGEFQQLEVAFSTMLGSKGKADALMQQLVQTAATTPFDLQSVSRGAKQLLAYGTAADEINDILIHLGDIAAGLSQPLDALVYLYGTTIVQGKMMTRDLRQFQNRGIPIAEQLAKQFGIAKSEVESYVSAGRVTADEFHKAIMGMASDGGKFAGLMSEQAKTITGQIRNIEDSIDIMFNEIGKSSEGVINFALSGVSKLVENYESVGRVIMGLVSAYGAYKAALIVCAAIEAARAKQATFSVAIGSKQVQMMNLLTKATWKQIAAQLKANAAAYANPYVAVAAALAAVVFVLINWNKWMDKAYDTAGKINRKYDESISKLNEEKEAAEQHIAVLKDETATTYELAKAKDALNKIDLLKDVNIAGMTPEQIEEEIKKIYETRAKEEKKLQFEQHQRNLDTGADKYARPRGKGAEESILNSMRESVKFITEWNFEKYSEGKTDEEKLNSLDNLIKKKVQEKEEWERKLAEFNATPWLERKNKNSGEIYEYYAAQAQAFIDNYEQQKETINDGIKKANEKYREENTGNSLYEIIYGYTATNDKGEKTFINGILKQEEAVKKAREQYAKKSSAANKELVESAEAGLKDLTDKYKLATGENWVSTEEFLKAKEKEERDAARKSIDIAQQEYSKRVQLADKYKRDLEDLDIEEAEWKKKNKGRAVPSYFTDKRAVIEAQFEFDKSQLDKEFNEWIEGIQRETGNIDFSNFIDDLQLEIDIEPSYEIRKEKIDKRREAELRKVKEEGNRNKTEQLKEQFGDKSIELYNKLQEDGANREELLKGYAKDLHTDVTILEQVMQQIDSASKALDAQTAAQVSAKRRGFENEDIQGVYSEYYAIGEGLANYAGYELKKKAIADKYNELRGKAELVKDKGTKEKMLATFSDMQDKELKQLENNFFMSLTTTNADGSEMSIAERLMGKNGNVKLIETVRLLKLLKKAKQEIDGSNDKKVSSETSNAITDLTGLSADEIESLAANSNDMAVAWGGVRDAISSSVTELSNINTGNQGIDQVLLGISQAAEIATDETAGLSDKINSSVNIIFNTLSGAFQMVAETMSIIGEASHDGEIMETAEVFSGITQNFSAAAQGAATGGWVGAIVGGVTDALGQIINAVVQNISAAHEAKVAYQQWADAAREVSYSQSLQSKNNIFGENNVDKLTTALDTLRKVKDDYLETTKGLEEASQKDAEELKKLLSEKNALIAGITMASISIVGLTNAQMWKDWERNKQALDEYKDSLYEVLVGGFYKNGKQNIDGFVKAIENGYSALEAMQIKTLDKSGSRKDEYKALKDLAPEVFNEDGSIDTEMLDAFMQAYGDKLTEEQRMLLEQLKVQQDAYNEAFEQATEYYTNLFGNVGTSLMDAFESEMVRGEDALDSFTDSIADTVEEWVRQFAYMAYIQPYLMDATKMIEDAVSAEGATTESINAAMDEALAYIFGNFNEMQDGYTAFLQYAQGKYGDMFGMDLFQDEDAEGSQGFGQMTQDQADTLTARFTAVQIEMANVSATTQAMAGVVSLVGEDVKLGVAGIQSLLYNSNIALQMAQDQLDQMQIIADNTAMLAETNTRLKAIEQNTGRL